MSAHHAIFSSDGIYRYTLWRDWIGGDRYVMFIGLNPSTATDTVDDPTIRRCVSFAKLWGFGGLCMCNLFAFRATKPKEMLKAEEPIGADNDNWIKECSYDAGLIVAAWGNHGAYMARGRYVSFLLDGKAVKCFGKTKVGCPLHPLYLPKSRTLENL